MDFNNIHPLIAMTGHRIIGMLYSASAIVAIVIVGLLSACSGLFVPSEADLSAFGEYVYRIDSVQLREGFRRMMVEETSQSSPLLQCYTDRLSTDAFSVWHSRMGTSDDADSLLSLLQREVPAAGLDPTFFRLDAIASDLDVVRKLAFDSLGIDINTLLPRLDFNLSRAYVFYTIGQRYGFVRPDLLFNQLERKDDSKNYTRLFDYAVTIPNPSGAVQHLLADDRMDYLFQSEPCDSVYLKLRHQLSVTSDAALRRQLSVNMERCRWHLKKPRYGDRYVLVNLPAQQLWAVCPDSVVGMRICFGKTKTKTPLLQSEINRIDVNPDWIITPNIIKNEVSVHAGDSAYFARNRYYIVELSTGDTLSPSRVTMAQLKSGKLRVGQHGGKGNSLGRLVFRFPNTFSVYLHDTSNHSAFSWAERTLSHGCVRVQKPFDLALFALPELDEWDVDRLRLSIDLEPETDRGRDYLDEHTDDPRPLRLIRQLPVKPALPLYIVYYTVYPNPETGSIETWSDPYGYDSVIAKAHPCLLP